MVCAVLTSQRWSLPEHGERIFLRCFFRRVGQDVWLYWGLSTFTVTKIPLWTGQRRSKRITSTEHGEVSLLGLSCYHLSNLANFLAVFIQEPLWCAGSEGRVRDTVMNRMSWEPSMVVPNCQLRTRITHWAHSVTDAGRHPQSVWVRVSGVGPKISNRFLGDDGGDACPGTALWEPLVYWGW